MTSMIRWALAVTAGAALLAAVVPAGPAAASPPARAVSQSAQVVSPPAVDPAGMAGICALFAGEVGADDSGYWCDIAEGRFRCEAAAGSCGYWPLTPVTEPLDKPCGRVSGSYSVALSVATCRADSGTVVVVDCPPDPRDPDGFASRCGLGSIPNEPPKKPGRSL